MVGDFMKTIIIGGGASGLACAIKAKNKNNEIIILEKESKCGKKILVTGNGKCNYFNDDFTIDHYNSNNKDILNEVINEDNKKLVLDFFDSIGIIPKIKDNYYYPVTNQAITIREALVNYALKIGVKIITDVNIVDINYNGKYEIITTDNTYTSDNLVLATSLLAMKGNEFGINIARKFNHSVIEPLPALVQLKGNEKYFKEWAGIRTDVNVSLYINDNYIKNSEGEIQLTDYGISGICIFQLSSLVNKALYDNKKVNIKINFIPWINNNIKEFLSDRNNKLNNPNISDLLDGMINYKLVNLILDLSNISRDKKYNELTNNDINNIINYLTNFDIKIIDSMGFDKAQVCSGGIPLNEININNMSSYKNNNLYIIGELLDVDGECGGYNLGFAWVSGLLAGIDINDKN